MSATVAIATPAAEEAASPSFVSPVAVTSVDETQYKPQLQAKIRKLKELFAEFNPPELEVFESPPSHYRMRAEFTIEQRDGNFRYIMFDNSPPTPNATANAVASAASADGVAPGGGGGGGEAATGAGAADTSTSAPAAAAALSARGGGRPKGPRRVTVESFPVASRQLNELMEVVRRECAACPELRGRLFQANFHTTLAGDAMVTLLYHRKLGTEWSAAAERLRDALAATPTAAAAGRRPHVIGRSRKQKLEHDVSFVLERLAVGGREYVQKQVEGAFSQPNGAVCQHMLGWALDVTRPQQQEGEVQEARGQQQQQEEEQQKEEEEGKEEQAQKRLRLTPQPQAQVDNAEGVAADGGGEGKGEGGAQKEEAEQEAAAEDAGGTGGPQDDLLELYCGNGNFTVPLAQNFRRVVATEVSKSSVEAARFNMEANGVANVFLARMASEEFAETMRARGSRRRLEGLGAWEELRLRTILVDPPRAGLDEFTVQLLKEFDRIVYISCNPETLHANLRSISATHRIARFAAFDQFPYTHHLECGLYLTRKEQ